MKTATLKEFQDISLKLAEYIESGEEIAISNDGKIIARVVPAPQTFSEKGTVDWTTSAAFTMDRSNMPVLTAEQVTELLEENKGKW